MTAPAEFSAEDFEVVVTLGVQQADWVRPTLDQDAGPRGQEDIGLTIAGHDDMALISATGGPDGDTAGPRHHQRPVAQGVGADGDQGDGVQGRVDQGAATGQGIGCLLYTSDAADE